MMWSLGSGQLNKNLDDTSGSFATLSNRKRSIGRYHVRFRVINSYIIFWLSIANIIIFITDLSGNYFLEWLFSQWNVKKCQMACSSSSQKSKDVQTFSLYRTEKSGKFSHLTQRLEQLDFFWHFCLKDDSIIYNYPLSL